jgi:hypothetical protein
MTSSRELSVPNAAGQCSDLIRNVIVIQTDLANQNVAPSSKQAWHWFPIQRTPEDQVQMGDLVFLPNGVVVIANTAHADGNPIEQESGSWRAMREPGFKQVLVIVDTNGETSRYSYQQDLWWRAVAYEMNPKTGWGERIRREIAHRGILNARFIAWGIEHIFIFLLIGLYYSPVIIVVLSLLGLLFRALFS